MSREDRLREKRFPRWLVGLFVALTLFGGVACAAEVDEDDDDGGGVILEDEEDGNGGGGADVEVDTDAEGGEGGEGGDAEETDDE